MEEFGKLMELSKRYENGDKAAEKELEKLVPRCTMCGELFGVFDYYENNCFTRHIGYDSKYDLNKLTLNLCIKCFDKILDFIVPQCKENPLTKEDE